MTPDSPVCGLVRLNFSQDDIKVVSRVFGTQVLRRPFQPFGRSRRLHKRCQVVSPRSHVATVRRDIPLHPHRGGWSGSRKASRYHSQIVQISHGSSLLGWKGWN